MFSPAPRASRAIAIRFPTRAGRPRGRSHRLSQAAAVGRSGISTTGTLTTPTPPPAPHHGPRWLRLAVAIALVAAGCSRAAPDPPATTTADAQPVEVFWVVADPAEIDLGVAAPGTPLAGTLTLNNPGYEPATIQSVVTRAPLRPIDAEGLVVPARGRLDLPIALTPSHVLGEREAACVISFVESPRAITATARGVVARAVHSTPSRLVIDRSAGAHTLVIASIDDRPFRILEVIPGTVEIVDESDDGAQRSRWRLRLEIDQGSPGDLPAYALVATDHPECGVLEIPIRHPGRPTPGRLRTLEGRLNLGTISPGAHTFELTVAGLAEGEEVEAIESDTAHVTARLVEAAPDPRSAGAVRCTGTIIIPEHPPGLFTAAVVVLGSSGEAIVPVFARINGDPPG